MSEEYAFTLKLDHKTIEEVLKSVFRNIPLEKSVFELHTELLYKRDCDDELISGTGLTKSLQDSVVMLPQIAHYSRPVNFGQQEVSVLGPYSLLGSENMRYSFNSFNPFYFVATKKKKEELSERIFKQGEQFLERQHQLWITPSTLVIYQSNSYECKTRKHLFGKRHDLLIKPEIYGLVDCEFSGPFDANIYMIESKKGIIDLFLNGLLQRIGNNEVERNSWCILTNESFPRTAESFILEKGFKKDTSCENKISEG